MELACEWKILGNPIKVGGMDIGNFAQTAAAMGVFALSQVAPAGAKAQRLAGGGDFEPLGHGLFRFDAFGTSHKLFKRAFIIRPLKWQSRGKTKKFRTGWGGESLRVPWVPLLFHGILNTFIIGHFAGTNGLAIIS